MKISRSDWKRELEGPEKSASIQSYSEAELKRLRHQAAAVLAGIDAALGIDPSKETP